MKDNVTNLPVAEKPVDKTRTISLTGRAPIQIKESEWPIIAEGWSGWENNGAPYSLDVHFKFRQGKHCQVIVYATYGYWEDDYNDHCQDVRVGRLTTVTMDHTLWQHMREVGEELRERILKGDLKKYVTLAVDRCFEKLEPEER